MYLDNKRAKVNSSKEATLCVRSNYCSFLSFSLEAAWTPTCTSFVYVNGINTPPDTADRTVTSFLRPQFQTHLTKKGKAGNCYSIQLLYRPTAGFTVDLFESARLFFNQNSDALNRFIDHNELFQTGTSTEQTALTFAMTNTPKSGLVNTVDYILSIILLKKTTSY